MRFHGHEIHVQRQGPEGGDVALLLHSSGLSGRQWRAYLDPLTRLGLRCVVPDLIGYGGSQAWRGQGPFHLHADLRTAAELASAERFPLVLVGHSYGGLLALQLAAELPPERVRAVVVYEPIAWGAAYAAGETEALQRFIDDGFFDDATGGSVEWMRRFVDFWNGPGSWAELSEAAQTQMMKAGRKTFEEVRSLCFEYTPASHYARITCPTLVLSGDQSPAIERRVCELIAEALPAGELLRVEGAGHLGVVRGAAELAPKIAAWLAKAGVGSAP